MVSVIMLLLLLGACLEVTQPGALVPPTVDQDPALPHLEIEVAGHRRLIHLEQYGEAGAPTILVLHGSLADLRAWRPYRVLAEDGYQVVMWDQRGNGLSERILAEEYTNDAIVEEIEAVREVFSPDEPVILLGHSFGAMFSALYLSLHPEQVRGAVLIEPGGLNGRIWEETYDEVINIKLFGFGLNQMFWQSEVLTADEHEVLDYRALMYLQDPEQTNYFCDRERPPELPVWRPGGFVDTLRGSSLLGASGGGFRFNYAEGLDQNPMPVLLIGSACSALGSDFQRTYHQPLLGNAEVAHVEDAGHRLIVEQPEAVLELIRGYLQDLESAGR